MTIYMNVVNIASSPSHNIIKKYIYRVHSTIEAHFYDRLPVLISMSFNIYLTMPLSVIAYDKGAIA